VDIQHSGVKSTWHPGFFYEEYAGEPAAHVLNGFLFSLAGLFDHYRITNSKSSKELLDLGFEWLAEKLPTYNANFTSYYIHIQPTGQFANAVGDWPFDRYHELHINQLLWAYDVSGNPIFYQYAHKFLQQDLHHFSYLKKPKWKETRASSCIDCENYGASNLTDGYWSFSNYWSCNNFPCTLVLVPEDKIQGLERIVLFSYSSQSTSKAVKVSFWSAGEKFELDGAKEINESSRQLISTGKHETYIQHFLVRYETAPIDSLEFELIPENGNKIIALREIDVHFDRKSTLEELRTIYRYNSNEKPRPAPYQNAMD
jgi:hypothetical protein